MLLYNCLSYRYSVVRDPYLGLRTVVNQVKNWQTSAITAVIQRIRLIPSMVETGIFFVAGKIKQSIYFEDNIFQRDTPLIHKWSPALSKSMRTKRYEPKYIHEILTIYKRSWKPSKKQLESYSYQDSNL
jgi:hypothetical protein